MKKLRFLLPLILLFTLLVAGSALAFTSKYSDIPSVRINVNVSELQIGDELSDNADSYVSVPDNRYYYIEEAEWLDDIKSLHVGDQPRMRVWLYAYPYEIAHENYDVTYLFRGAYGSGNVHVSKGEFIAATRADNGYQLEVTLRINPIKGQYSQPEYASWTSTRGVARWEPGDSSSGYYDIICYRGTTQVKRLWSYYGTSYNFYPYMTKEGEYSFKVRCVRQYDPKTQDSQVGTASEWVESGVLNIEKNQVSDGTGQTSTDESNAIGYGANSNSYPDGTGNASVAGWYYQDGNTYFRYPNGTFVQNGWMQMNGNWYLFDAQGRMQKGWAQNKYVNWFYLDKTNGVMRTGWLQDGDYWYFLKTEKDNTEGSMVKGWMLQDGKKYYFNESGHMVTGWYQVDGKWYYFYPQGSTQGSYGYLASNTTVDNLRIGPDGSWQP